MLSLDAFSDIHTHHSGRPDAVLSAPPVQAIALAGGAAPGQVYSLELHPWYASEELMADFRRAVALCRDDAHCVAIGECGLDGNRGPAPEVQSAAFRLALETASELDLPVVVHCVRAWEPLFSFRREFPGLRMIVHGFRKGPDLARRLVEQGIALSLGEKFNPEVAAITPDGLLYAETDESEMNICQIREKILSSRLK